MSPMWFQRANPASACRDCLATSASRCECTFLASDSQARTSRHLCYATSIQLAPDLRPRTLCRGHLSKATSANRAALYRELAPPATGARIARLRDRGPLLLTELPRFDRSIRQRTNYRAWRFQMTDEQIIFTLLPMRLTVQVRPSTIASWGAARSAVPGLSKGVGCVSGWYRSTTAAALLDPFAGSRLPPRRLHRRGLRARGDGKHYKLGLRTDASSMASATRAPSLHRR